MDLFGLLEEARRGSPGRPAVVDGERRLDYAGFHRRACGLARCLAARGLGPGDRVAILAWNGVEYLEAYFAAAALGAVLVPLNARLVAAEIEAVVAACGARLRIVDPALGPRGPGDLVLGRDYEEAVERHAGELSPAPVAADAPAQLYYTSGTTGRPKGVVLTQGNVLAHARAAIGELDLARGDTWAHLAPMFHLADAWAVFAITAVGGVHATLPRFEARAALDLIERERATITNVVPTMLARMVDEARGREVRGLRLLLTGGAPIAPDLALAAVRTFRCEYAQTYGMTETSPFLTLARPRGAVAALPEAEQLRFRCKTGRAFGPVELRVVGSDGRDVPADCRSVGEILARGPTVTPGYWEDPAATRAAFEDGWLRTGDLAVVDEWGYLSIVDRRKDVVKTRGETVYSTEVEHALSAHPAVLEAAVVGVPDADLGERVVAAVVLRQGSSASAEELREACRSRIAGFKVPREVRLVGDLPRTGSGKVSKRELREGW